MKIYGKNMSMYTVELSFVIDEDKIRTEEEIRGLLKEIFNTDSYKFLGAAVIDNECIHEWERVGITDANPNGWGYNCPSYKVKYVCTKCGKKKYVTE